MQRIVRSTKLVMAMVTLGACATPRAATPAAATGLASSATVLQPDRTALVADLEQTRAAFLAAMAGLSEAQLRFKAAPDRWSIAEVAEHITLAEELLFKTVSEKVMVSPMTPELRAQVKVTDAGIAEGVRDRTKKRQAREVLRPTGRWKSGDEVVAAFTHGRAATLALASDPAADLRGHALEHPVVGMIDAHQWLLFLSAHSARHTAQILEVKADPGFPKG